MLPRRLAAAALIAAAAFLLVWLTRPAAPPPLVQLSGPTMGSTYAISYHGKGAPNAAQMQREVQAILDEVDAAVSTYRSDSALARFNAAPAGTCMDMPQAATDLAQHAISLSQQSGGAFDTTLLPALQAWGFGHSKAPALPASAPDEAQLAELRQRTGMTHLRVQGQQLCKDAPIHVEFNACKSCSICLRFLASNFVSHSRIFFVALFGVPFALPPILPLPSFFGLAILL